MKNVIKNKKGFEPISLSLTGGLALAAVIAIAVIFFLVVGGVLGTGIWLIGLIVKNIFYIIGAAVMILGITYGIGKSKNPAVFILAVILLGAAVMSLQFLKVPQTMFPDLALIPFLIKYKK